MQGEAAAIFNSQMHDLRDQMLRTIDCNIEAVERELAELRVLRADLQRVTRPVIGLPSLPAASEEPTELPRFLLRAAEADDPVRPPTLGDRLAARLAEILGPSPLKFVRVT
jgi:hypothetical protein